jgi:hypothetical protein
MERVGSEMTQALYAHMNNKTIKKKQQKKRKVSENISPHGLLLYFAIKFLRFALLLMNFWKVKTDMFIFCKC